MSEVLNTFRDIRNSMLGGSVRWLLKDDANNTVMFDVTTEYVRDWPGTATERPIEDRTTITDHVRRNQQRIDFTGLINSDVLGAGLSLTLDILLASRFKQLELWRDDVTLLTFAGRNIIKDVVIEKMSERKSSATRGAMLFNMTLKKMVLATTPAGSIGEVGLQSEETPL